MMEIKKESKVEETLAFTITGSYPAFVNSIRRAIIEDVPTMAIEEVEFRQNSSAMFDEVLAHRLGLVPLKTDLTSYVFRNDEGSAANQCTFTLEATGPMTVTAGMMKSSDANIVPVYPDIILVELLEGQAVSIEAKAILGIGRTHAKWSSGLAYYTYGATVDVVPGEALDVAKSKLPDGAFDASGNVSAKAIMDNGLVDAVDGVCPENIKVTYDDTQFTVTVESWGQLPAVVVVEQAVMTLQSALEEFVQALEVLK